MCVTLKTFLGRFSLTLYNLGELLHFLHTAYLWLAAPVRVSFRMEGGVNTTELSSVPNRLLLGVSAKHDMMLVPSTCPSLKIIKGLQG